MKKPKFRYEPDIDPIFAKYALTIKESLDEATIDFLMKNYNYACTGYLDNQPMMCALLVPIQGIVIFGGAVLPRKDTRFVFHYALKCSRRLLRNVKGKIVRSVCKKNDTGTILTLGKLGFMIIAMTDEYLITEKRKR